MLKKTQNVTALKQVLTEILGELCTISDCQSIGIRLHNNGDYPYFIHEGFPEFFLSLKKTASVQETSKATLSSMGTANIFWSVCVEESSTDNLIRSFHTSRRREVSGQIAQRSF